MAQVAAAANSPVVGHPVAQASLRSPAEGAHARRGAQRTLVALILATLVSGCGGAAGGAGAAAAATSPGATAAGPPIWPASRREETREKLHGVEVADPYRWLEDPDSAEAQAWITAQNAATAKHLGAIAAREPIARRIEAMWAFDRRWPEARRGDVTFQLRQSGLQNQPHLVVSGSAGSSGSGSDRVLLDPNALAADGTVALKQVEIDAKGQRIAWMTGVSGSDWSEIRLRDVATGKDEDDHLRWVKFSGIAWADDGSGFYYSAYDAPPEGKALTQVNEFQRLYFHRLGDKQTQDAVVAENKAQKDWNFAGEVSDDGRLLYLPIWRGATKTNALRVGRLPLLPSTKAKPNKSIPAPQPTGGAPTAWIDIDMTFDDAVETVGNVGELLLLRTDKGAPTGRIVSVDLRQPTEPWQTLVPAGKDNLQEARIVGGRLVVVALRDANSVLRIHELDGSQVAEVALPTLGTVAGLSGRPRDRELRFGFQSFTWPGAVLSVDVAAATAGVAATVAWQPTLPFDSSAFVAEQRSATSRDGTRVPYFLVRRKDLQPNGQRPVWLHGYGGFDIAMVPSFRVERLQWVEMGGVYVLANLRGGGEYGSDWHKAGMLGNKQNVFEDFYAVARDLHAKGWARPETTGIAGGSNGGLLVGAAITQHPELFGAALPAVGVLDMLRYHTWTIGWAWVPEYGSADDAKAFQWLYAYSPYHNAKPQAYPATLITTADHDDRVVPAHSFKFTAALQHAQRGPAPVLIRVEQKAGHGAGKPTRKRIDEAADTMAFFVQALGPQRFDRLPTR